MIDHINYTVSEESKFNEYLLPIRSDPYCAIEFLIFVNDNITNNRLLYTQKFDLDFSTTILHEDGISRTESFLIKNQSFPEVGKHKLTIYQSDTDYTKLDRFTKSATNDYYLYTIEYVTRIKPGERSGGNLFQSIATFTLKLFSWCQQITF